MISIREAALETGKAKPTILKAIKSGRLSAAKNVKGEWEVAPVELFRVYPAINPKSDSSLDDVTNDYKARIRELEERVSEKAKEIEDLQRASESWETMAHSWRVQTETVTKLLTHNKEQEPGLFNRIFR